MEGVLVLVRHGQSVGSSRNEFTGWLDVGLSPQGVTEAEATGQRRLAMWLRFNVVFTSALRRAWDRSHHPQGRRSG